MKKNKEDIIIDYIDNIVYNEKTFPIRNMHALYYTRRGLYELALIIRKDENRINQNSGHYIKHMAGMGAVTEMSMNYFNWFSISIINYVRLIGFIDIVNKNNFTREDIIKKENHQIIKTYCREYIKKVIPDIYTYRNKLAAHHSLTDPFKDDNIATLESSVLNTIVYNYPYIEAGLDWNSRINVEDEMTKTKIKKWSLTKTYDNLTARYWNDMKIPKLEKSKIILRKDVVFGIWCPKCKFTKHKIEKCPKCGFVEQGQPIKI